MHPLLRPLSDTPSPAVHPNVGSKVLLNLVRIGVGLLLALVLSPLGVQPSFAHATLVSSTPEEGETVGNMPEYIEVEFNESIRIVSGQNRLYLPDGTVHELIGTTADNRATFPLPSTSTEGTHTFGYRIISADGHPVSGVITFHVGEPGPGESTTPPAPVPSDSEQANNAVFALTFVKYVGLFIFVGLVYYNRFIPSRGSRGRLITWARNGYIMATVSALCLVPVLGLRAIGAPLTGVFSGSWVATVSWDSLTTAAIVTGAGAVSIHHVGKHQRSTGLALGLATTCALTPTLTGHTHIFRPLALMVGADAIHILSATVWFGGLLGLLAASLKPDLRGVGRFSSIALVCTATLVISGTVMAFLGLPSPSSLLSTGYGRILVVKLLLASSTLVIAKRNWSRVARAQQGGQFEWSALRMDVAREVSILVVVLAVTGLLTNLSPNHQVSQPSSEPVEIVTEDQGLRVTGQLAPASTGANTIDLELSYLGESLSLERVEITARQSEVGPIQTEVHSTQESGKYHGDLFLPAPGEWTLAISARVDTYTKATALFTVSVR